MSWGVMSQHMGWGSIDEGWRKGPWTAEEDRLLIEYVKSNGEGRWNNVARLAGMHILLFFPTPSLPRRELYLRKCCWI